MEIVWTTTPPPQPMRSDIGLLAIEAGESVVVRLLGPCWFTTCHWTGEASIICTGAKTCKVHAEPTNIKGFSPVQALNRSWRGRCNGVHPGVLVVTPEIGAFVAACVTGDVLCVSRPPGSSRSPLSACHSKIAPPGDIIEGFDPRPYALRAMKIRGRKFVPFRKQA
jgi:hypothetical protein